MSMPASPPLPPVLPNKPTVLIASPFGQTTQTGNWQTARRYADHLEDAGHAVNVLAEYDGRQPLPSCDVAIVLHARRSREVAAALTQAAIPFAVVLTGTDLYADLQQPDTPAFEACRQTIDEALLVVTLQSRAAEELVRILPQTADKRRVIAQAVPLEDPSDWAKRYNAGSGATLTWLISGHVRSEKDPLTGLNGFLQAFPNARLEDGRETHLTHVGGARDPSAVEALVATTNQMPPGSVTLLGARPHDEAVALMAQHHCLIQPSRMEGGALVISEAAAHRLPVLASRIDGHLGLLGEDYPGYFEVGNPADLAVLMRQFAQSADYREELRQALIQNTPALTSPLLEKTQLKSLIERLRQR
jgi:glycosyltransferase involved in cell wall biosynthesis